MPKVQESVLAAAPPRPRSKRSTRPSKIALTAVLVAGALLTAFPFLWMMSTAFKPLSESVSSPPRIVPSAPTLEHFTVLFRDLDFLRYLANTLGVVLISYTGLLFMAMAGYALAKFQFRFKQPIFILVMATMMIPIQVTMIPSYLILNELKLTGTLVGIAAPALISGFGIFLFRQFMLTIPDEVLEAARLDGASEFTIFRKVVLPMSRPILAVQAILVFIGSWNSFLWPLILAGSQENYTLSVALSLLNKQVSVNPSLQMAGATVMVVPILIVFAIFQKHIVQGFSLSGLK